MLLNMVRIFPEPTIGMRPKLQTQCDLAPAETERKDQIQVVKMNQTKVLLETHLQTCYKNLLFAYNWDSK